MSGWVKAGKAGWEAIKGVKPGTKFKGQKTKESIIKAGKKKSWKDYVDESNPSYKKDWPPGN